MTKTKEHGAALRHFANLFDADDARHACEAIAEAIRGELLPGAMAATMRRHLLAPVEAYIADRWRPGKAPSNAVLAAERVHEEAARLVHMFEVRHPFGPDDAPAFAEPLRLAWLEFIATAAGPLVYHGAVKSQTQRETAGRRLRGAAAKLTPEVLAERVRAEGGQWRDWLALALADEFGVSERTVYARLKAARAAGLVP
ncbi:MAG: hypothetical protein HYZ20_16570 [Burkholderiales bacterium]|nr:hypothetical protein [Burkholderiales bacterium]